MFQGAPGRILEVTLVYNEMVDKALWGRKEDEEIGSDAKLAPPRPVPPG